MQNKKTTIENYYAKITNTTLINQHKIPPVAQTKQPCYNLFIF